MIVKRKLSTAEFLEFANLPQNANRLLELIEGEIVEKVASFTPSEIASTIGYYLKGFVLETPIGYVTGADGRYVISDEDTFMPDVGYISKARMPERPAREAPIPPDLAVEVKSPTNSKRELRMKAERYLQFGTKMVWLVFPDEQEVEVYVPDKDVMTVRIDGVLNGGDVLPGFQLPVRKIFPT